MASRGSRSAGSKTFPSWPCRCRGSHSVRGVVLDPFAGTGTVGRVAVQLGRDAVLCDLSGKYLAEHARARTSRVQTELVG